VPPAILGVVMAKPSELEDVFLPSYKIIINTSKIDFNQRNLLASKGYVVFYALDIRLISRGVILKLVQGIYDSSSA